MRTQLMMMIAVISVTAPVALGHSAGHTHLHSPGGWTGVMIGVAAVVVGMAALRVRRWAQRRW